MDLPMHARAAALVVALSTTSYIIVTIAEIGHPPPDPQGLVEFLTGGGKHPAPVASFTPQASAQATVTAEMPQP